MFAIRSHAAVVSLALSVLLGVVLPRTASAGPPWIGVELPVNPHDAATRDALAVVRLYHHRTPTPWPLEAHAVGMVQGTRRTVRLEARPVGTAGVVAIRGELPRGDGWVLVVTMQAGPTARVSALIALDRRGDVAGVRVPGDRIEEGRFVVPREATAREIDAMLQRAVARPGDPQVGAGTGGSLALAGVGAVVLLPIGWRRLRRR